MFPLLLYCRLQVSKGSGTSGWKWCKVSTCSANTEVACLPPSPKDQSLHLCIWKIQPTVRISSTLVSRPPNLDLAATYAIIYKQASFPRLYHSRTSLRTPMTLDNFIDEWLSSHTKRQPLISPAMFCVLLHHCVEGTGCFFPPDE